MYRYKRILVNLKMDAADINLMKHASAIAKMAKSEKLYFLFTDKSIDVPKELINEYPQLTESAGDFAREKIKETIDMVLDENNNPETMIIIAEGQELDELLKQVRINGIDLIITGISDELPQTKGLAVKLARKSPCSVMVVPNESEFSLENPIVSTDFSEHSEDAMDAALAFVKAGSKSKLNFIHVYQVPTGYHKTGKSYDEFGEIMKGHAENNLSEFKSKFELNGIATEEKFVLNKKTADAILSQINEDKNTILFIGARGRGAGAAVMLGSVTESLIERIQIPLLAVKKKGSGLNILNAIFN